MNMKWKRLRGIILDLLYPRRASCLGCGDMLGCDRDDICENCRAKLARGWIGLRPAPKGGWIDASAYAYSYHGPAGRLVRNLKYQGVWLLADEMGLYIARAARLLRLEENCYVTAVPMHPERMRVRGRNHAELLARVVAKALELEYVPLLERSRNARQQARLSAEDRRENLRGAFTVKKAYSESVNGATVLIVDDVYTTGATAINCAKTLKEAGAKRVYFAAYANGERKKHG